jgi:hypothetical protein
MIVALQAHTSVLRFVIKPCFQKIESFAEKDSPSKCTSLHHPPTVLIPLHGARCAATSYRIATCSTIIAWSFTDNLESFSFTAKNEVHQSNPCPFSFTRRVVFSGGCGADG